MLKKSISFFIIVIICMAVFTEEHSPYKESIDRARAYYERQEYTKAIEELKSVLGSPNKEEVAFAYYFIGYCYFAQNDYTTAINFFEKSLEYDPNYLESIEMIGILYSYFHDKNKQLKLSLKYLLRAEEMRSKNEHVYFEIAGVYAIKKDLEKAVIYLDKAVYYGYEIDIIKRDPDLENLHNTLYYQRLINNAHKLKTAKEYWKKAKQAEKNYDYANAVANYKLSLNEFILVVGEESLNAAACYSFLAAAYDDTGEYDKAIEYYEKTLAICLKSLGEDHPDTTANYTNLGISYNKKGEYDKAISYFEKDLAACLKTLGENSQEAASIYNNIGGAYRSKGDYNKAVNYHEKALAICLKVLGENHQDTAICYDNLGSVYHLKGEINKTLTCYEKALSIFLKVLGSNHPAVARSYNNIGTNYISIGEYEKAVSYFEKALAIMIKTVGENHTDTAASYNNIGMAYNEMGEYDKAIGYYQKALSVHLKVLGENHSDTATTYNNLASTYLFKGEYDKALEFYEKVLAVFLKVLGENHPDTAAVYNNIAEVYLVKGEYEKALSYFEKSLAIMLKTLDKDHPNMGPCYNNIGQAYHCKGEYDKAIGYYEKALEISSKTFGENHPETAVININNGLTYYQKGEYDKAIGYFEKAFAVLKKSGARQEAIICSNNLGILYLNLKNYQKAKIYFEEAIAVVEQARSQVGSGKAEFMARNIESYYYSLKCSALLKDPKGVFAASEAMRARGFLDRLSLNAALSVEGVSEADRKKMIELNDELESLVRQREHELKKEIAEQDRERLVKLADAILAKEKEFAALDAKLMKNERYKNLRRPALADLARAQKLCTDKSVILEYVIWEGTDENRQSYCLVITGKGTAVVELDKDFDYSGAVETLRDAVMASTYDPEAVDEPAALLYAALITPLEKELEGVEQLVIVPDGPLAFLPFDALKKQVGGPYLCESYAISLSPSVSVMMMVKGRSYKANRKELLAFGGAVYSKEGAGVDRGKLKGKKERGLEILEKENTAKTAIYEGLGIYYDTLGFSWENLPGTLEEVKQINGEVFGRKNTLLFTGADVSEQKVKELSRSNVLKEYKVIHFACHGYYEQSYPSFSSIIFSEVSKALPGPEDGYLTVEEAALLKLEVELVNMSACETGLGKIVRGDGVVGLTRALLVAGSNRVGVTLWSVADDATSEFMVQVYKKVVKEKKSIKQAYHETKLEFIRSNNFSSPYFWSPFVLYGSF
jgi:tetratricopeptide (TPR) repeat protein